MDHSLADRLVTTAAALLDESGLGTVTVREVARRTGVSHGAPRRHFPTLEALHAAVARRGLLDLTAAVTRAGDTPQEWAKAYVAFATARPDTFELLFTHDALEGAGSHLREVSLPLLAGWVERFRAERSGRSHEDALAAWAGAHGIAMLSARGALRLVDADADRLLQRVLR